MGNGQKELMKGKPEEWDWYGIRDGRMREQRMRIGMERVRKGIGGKGILEEGRV
jgi:hypothetical protein